MGHPNEIGKGSLISSKNRDLQSDLVESICSEVEHDDGLDGDVVPHQQGGRLRPAEHGGTHLFCSLSESEVVIKTTALMQSADLSFTELK